jgi:hypothetical protein
MGWITEGSEFKSQYSQEFFLLHISNVLFNGYPGLFPRGKAGRVWGWPLTSSQCQGQGNVDVCIHWHILLNYLSTGIVSPYLRSTEWSKRLDILRITICRVLHFEFKKWVYHLRVCDYLNNSFRITWIGRAARKHWVPRFPYQTPLDFFALGFNKSKTKVPDLHDLWQALVPNMLRSVFRTTVEHWE